MSGLILFAGLLLGAAAAWLGLRRLEKYRGADWGSAWLNRLDGFNRLLCRRFHRLRHDDLQLPSQGPALVVANHVSGLDPLLMIAASPRPLRFIIATEEYNRWWLRWLFRAIGCIPVDRQANPLRTLRTALAALEAGEIVALFPQGRIHVDAAPLELKRGVAYLADKTGAPIYPLRVEGVRGRGRGIPSLFIRSRARLLRFEPLRYDRRQPQAFFERLERILMGREAVPANGLKAGLK